MQVLELTPRVAPTVSADHRLPAQSVSIDVGEQRFHGRVHTRGAVPSSARPRGAADCASNLLADTSSFMPALSTVYGFDLARGFAQIVTLEAIATGPRFVVDEPFRRDVLAQLASRALAQEGFIVIRPSPSVWWQGGPASRSDEVHGPAVLALCELFGSIGFAQLCDPLLNAPVPLFVAPWRRSLGVIRPKRLPREGFSATLRVVRLKEQRMVLVDGRGLW